jgi:hypothetical protein
MHNTTLYASILGVVAPWRVTEVRTELAKGQILVHVDMAGDGKPSCPKCQLDRSTRGGAVHVPTTKGKYKGRVYETHLLRPTFREGGEVKHEGASGFRVDQGCNSRPPRWK